MKERFEGLSAWKEMQKEERDFLEKRLEEAKTKLNTMDAENEMLKKRVEELEKSGAEVSEATITQPRSIKSIINRLKLNICRSVYKLNWRH